LPKAIERFNASISKGDWNEEEGLGDLQPTLITILDDIISFDDDAVD
jgi:hypothetical protein